MGVIARAAGVHTDMDGKELGALAYDSIAVDGSSVPTGVTTLNSAGTSYTCDPSCAAASQPVLKLYPGKYSVAFSYLSMAAVPIQPVAADSVATPAVVVSENVANPVLPTVHSYYLVPTNIETVTYNAAMKTGFAAPTITFTGTTSTTAVVSIEAISNGAVQSADFTGAISNFVVSFGKILMQFGLGEHTVVFHTAVATTITAVGHRISWTRVESNGIIFVCIDQWSDPQEVGFTPTPEAPLIRLPTDLICKSRAALVCEGIAAGDDAECKFLAA